MLPQLLDRRSLLKAAGQAGFAVLGLTARPGAAAEDNRGPLSFGLVTDIHYADIPARGSRHYRDSLPKLRQAIDAFNQRQVAFVVQLGDLIDAGPKKSDDLQYLATVRLVLDAFQGRWYAVLGNHCVTGLSKEEFRAGCGKPAAASYFSFDVGGCHFVVLDADFRRDETPYAPGNFSWTDSWIPQHELRWLADDLQRTEHRRTFVFVHQNLDDEEADVGVKNAPAVRRVLEAAGHVQAVFQGHKHPGGYRRINGIQYCTLRALVEGPGLDNNAYAIVTVDRDQGFRLQGFGRQKDLAADASQK